MTSFKNLSIKSKLTWVSMLTSCVALLIACTAFVTYELFRFRQAMVLELSTLADVLGEHFLFSEREQTGCRRLPLQGGWKNLGEISQRPKGQRLSRERDGRKP